MVPLYLNSTQNMLVNWIIRQLLSILCWPKVIILSGGHCINKLGEWRENLYHTSTYFWLNFVAEIELGFFSPNSVRQHFFVFRTKFGEIDPGGRSYYQRSWETVLDAKLSPVQTLNVIILELFICDYIIIIGVLSV